MCASMYSVNSFGSILCGIHWTKTGNIHCAIIKQVDMVWPCFKMSGHYLVKRGNGERYDIIGTD